MKREQKKCDAEGKNGRNLRQTEENDKDWKSYRQGSACSVTRVVRCRLDVGFGGKL